MRKRLRHLNLSLAAKCQVLFGAAVVLIIAAALLVPWQRMEQLTSQINTSYARGLAQLAPHEHMMRKLARTTDAPATQAVPASRPLVPGPATRPKLRLLWPGGQPARLSKFEDKALRYLSGDRPATDFYYRSLENKQGQESHLYVWPLYAESACATCHGGDLPAATTRPAAAPPLLGLVTVEIPAQIEAFEVILNRIFLFVAGLLAGTLAIIVFYLITTKLILRPVRVLQETAERVSAGNLDIRSHIHTGDEFQQLSETFNRMLVNLKASEDQLRAINKSLDLKLVQMTESNVALHETNRLKSEFLANVSHELRTPLNSILGFAELVRDSASSVDSKSQRYAQNILESGRQLLDLINDLLDLAKIEAGKMEVRSEQLSLNDLFEGLLSILRPLVEKKSLAVMAQVAPDVPILDADAPKLQQVLFNFMSNAIKFSPVGGQINLMATRYDEDHVRIAVQDQGPGIAAEQQSMIFEKFRQLDGSATRQHGGTGLGLAISRELVGLMGGTIGVDSQVGQGATFWVIVPLQVTAGPQDIRSTVLASALLSTKR